MGANVTGLYPHVSDVADAVRAADVVIGAVLVTGARAPHVVSADMVRTMEAGSVIVDISVDQGGCIETTKPTTWEAPTYQWEGVTHFCVTNMPGSVPRTSSQALSAAIAPFAVRLADGSGRVARRSGAREGHQRGGGQDHASGALMRINRISACTINDINHCSNGLANFVPETTYDRTKPGKRFTAAVSRGLRESAVIAIGVVALVMLVALLSYDSNDPGFSSTGAGDDAVQTASGRSARGVASLLFFLFGRPAYLFPLMLGVACFVMFRQAPDEEGRTRFNTAVRIARLHADARSRAAVSRRCTGTRASLPATAGGVVGHIGTGHRIRLQFPRRHAAAARGVDGRSLARVRRLLAHDH